MGRAIAALVIGIILLVGVFWIADRLSHHLHGHGGTVIKIVALIAIAVLAYWAFGEGLVFEYFNS